MPYLLSPFQQALLRLRQWREDPAAQRPTRCTRPATEIRARLGPIPIYRGRQTNQGGKNGNRD
jgi:hypothetical protein